MELQRYFNRNALTVKELREALEDYADDTPVVFSYTSSDYWRTKVAEKVTEVDTGKVVWSEYHRQPKTLDPDRDEDDADVGASVKSLTVVVLGAA